MAFSIKTWVDRVVEHAGRKTLTNVSTGEETVVDMTRNEGEVTVTGDTFSAANMNDLETRISEAFGTNGNHYGTCSTAAATAAKVVATDDDFALTAGVSIKVKFTASNTASSPTLNVNSTGAKAIVSYGTTAIPTYDWATNGIVEFVYDGTSWIVEDGTLATMTHYGRTKLSSSTSSTSTALAATPSAVKAAYDLATTAQSAAEAAQSAADTNATAISELNENIESNLFPGTTFQQTGTITSLEWDTSSPNRLELDTSEMPAGYYFVLARITSGATYSGAFMVRLTETANSTSWIQSTIGTSGTMTSFTLSCVVYLDSSQTVFANIWTDIANTSWRVLFKAVLLFSK